MRAVAFLLIAVQLLLAGHGLWHEHQHHHDEACQGDHSGEDRHDSHTDSPCEFCLIAHQPQLSSPRQVVVVPLAPARSIDRAQPVTFDQTADHAPTSIRGPPGPCS